MSLKKAIFISDICSTTGALIANFTLLYLIRSKTPDDLKPYAKILRQKSLVDTFFTIVIAATFLEAEIDAGQYIFFLQGVFRNLLHPWNGMLCITYFWAMYFCVGADFIPFYYRYLLIVKDRKITTKEFYFLYIGTGLLSTIICIGAYLSFWPSTYGDMQEDYLRTLGDFWRDEMGNYPVYIAGSFPNPYLIATVFCSMLVPSGSYSLIAYFCVKTLKTLKDNRLLMSEKTKKMQKNLTLTLLAQACAPMISAVLPIFIVLFSMLFGFGIKHMGPVLTSSISWVVVLNPIIVIAIVAPYRDAVLGRKRVKRVVKYTMVKMRHSVKRNLVNPNDTTVQGTGSERIYTIA